MLPPIIRRCPECGTISWSHRFAIVDTETYHQLVECPSCAHRFSSPDNPWLN